MGNWHAGASSYTSDGCLCCVFWNQHGVFMLVCSVSNSCCIGAFLSMKDLKLIYLHSNCICNDKLSWDDCFLNSDKLHLLLGCARRNPRCHFIGQHYFVFTNQKMMLACTFSLPLLLRWLHPPSNCICLEISCKMYKIRFQKHVKTPIKCNKMQSIP